MSVLQVKLASLACGTHFVPFLAACALQKPTTLNPLRSEGIKVRSGTEAVLRNDEAVSSVQAAPLPTLSTLTPSALRKAVWSCHMAHPLPTIKLSEAGDTSGRPKELAIMVKVWRYMKSEEFKERQTAFEFFCARSVEFLEAFQTECVKGWKELFTKKLGTVPTQSCLDFRAPLNVFWLIPKFSALQ